MPMSVDLARAFAGGADRLFLTAVEGPSLTYGAAWANARRLADQWAGDGLRKGDRVAFVAPNDIGVAIGYLASLVGGFVFCPVPGNLLGDAVDEFLKILSPAKVIRTPPAIDAGIAAPEPGDIAFGHADDDPCAVIFSSGTTAEPKGICHSFKGLLSSAAAFSRLSGMSAETRMYHCLPMYYMAGLLNSILAPMMAGGQVIIGPMFAQLSAFDFWRHPLSSGANIVVITPTMASALCRSTRNFETAKAALARMTDIHCTAGQLTGALRRRFREVFGRCLQDCYGLTELGGPLTVQDAVSAAREDNVGAYEPEIEVDLRPTEGGLNRLFIRSPFMMLGYVTAAGMGNPVPPGEFMDTGDCAELMGNRLVITGRLKDVIVRGGINIPPKLVEGEIGRVEGVEDVAAIGVPHEFWGEAMIACVQALPGADEATLKATIEARCRQHLSPPHRPDLIAFVHKMPRTPIGKIKKNVLASEMATRLARGDVRMPSSRGDEPGTPGSSKWGCGNA